MAVKYVESFDKGHTPEPVRVFMDGEKNLKVQFADGEYNYLGTFQDNGVLELCVLDDEFAERLEKSGFTLLTVEGDKYLKVTK